MIQAPCTGFVYMYGIEQDITIRSITDFDQRKTFFYDFCNYSAPPSRNLDPSIELAQIVDPMFLDGADKARSASDRLKPGMLLHPGLGVLNTT